MPYIHSVSCAFPKNYYDQESLLQELRKYWKKKYFNVDRIEAFHRNVLVGGRHTALPLEEYGKLSGFGDRNDAWIRVALEVATEAVSKLLEKSQLSPEEIELLASATVTGLAVPSLEARLMNKISFSRKTKRLPIFGLGCLAGAAGINRVADYLKGHPKAAAIFFSVELCSLTIQFEDLSIQNIISTGLFGDGGAAVLVVGDEHPLAKESPLELLSWQSAFFPETERVMGWDIVDSGFKVVLSKSVPEIVAEEMPKEVQELLQQSELGNKLLQFFIAHPGGPKVLESMEKVFSLEKGELKYSWESLASHGNMSSVSVLFVLAKTLENLPPRDSLGLISAMGPAFCAELGLLRCSY